jgi:hypothetical protein
MTTKTTTPRVRGKSHTVTLSGGTVTLSLSVDPFTLTEADRRFVFELVDKVTGYGKRNGKAKAEPVDTPGFEASQVEPTGGYGA